MGVLILSFLSLPAYGSDDDSLLRFSMQVGSIMYTLFIVYWFVTVTKVRMILLATYISLTVSAYLFTLHPVFELDFLLTVFICSIIPLLSIVVLVIFIRILRKT